jgi:hypothetical protein
LVAARAATSDVSNQIAEVANIIAEMSSTIGRTTPL